ncbi:MAG: hypothetical protein HWN68_15440 [Desulfobacterales bacterium]|nr:hypothetical protein [Desulfobacterales bacterium]
MGRKSLLKATVKKSVKPKEGSVREEAGRKKAILDAVKRLPGSAKATLQRLGLAQSTYYKWLQQYKANGMDGLSTGKPVSDNVWKRFLELQNEQEELQVKIKSAAEETETMKSQEEKEKTRELLFKRFDEGPPKPPEKEAVPKLERAPETAGPKVEKAPPSPPTYTPPEEPVGKTLKYAVWAFALVIAILLATSLSNWNKFYFRQNEQMVELWRGRFAPMGESLVASFSDTKIIEDLPQQESYTKKQAFVVLSDYFINRADEILSAGETPDLKTAKSYLTHASKYAQSDSERQAIQMRLNSINFLVLLGKADLALRKGTMPDFEAAKGYLAEAVPLASTDLQKEVLTKRLAAIEYAVATSKISRGERQLADLYREAVNHHLKKAKEYGPEKAEKIDEEIIKIEKWLEEFDRKHVRR